MVVRHATLFQSSESALADTLISCPASSDVGRGQIDIFQKIADVRDGPSPCENAKTLDRDRTSYSFKVALGTHTAVLLFFKSNLRIPFSSRLEFLSFRTA
jgi:hypothetical protein